MYILTRKESRLRVSHLHKTHIIFVRLKNYFTTACLIPRGNICSERTNETLHCFESVIFKDHKHFNDSKIYGIKRTLM